MPYINDEIFDGGLDYADTNGLRIDICNAAPSNYTQATSTYSLGNKTVNTGAPGNAASGTGREVIVPAINDGTVGTTGTASHWALTDNSTVLLAWGTLSSNQSVTATNTWTLDAISITIRDPT